MVPVIIPASIFAPVMLKTAWVCLWLLLLAGLCPAQDTPAVKPWSGAGIAVNAIGGKVFKHEAKFTLPIPAFSSGLDVNLVYHTYGKRQWEQRRNYPVIGFALSYVNYGMDAVYGSCIGAYPNLTIPLLTGDKIDWTLRLGNGVGFATRQYSRINPVDTINVAVSSTINDFIMIMTDIHYHANEHWDIQGGANITHISNGSFRKPNLGINMAGAHLGITYFPVTSRPPHLAGAPSLSHRYLLQLHYGMSLVSSHVSGGPLYPVYVTSAAVSRRWKGGNKLFAGIDYAYHQNIYAFLRNNELAKGSEQARSWKSTVFAGNEFIYGRIGIVLQAGIYLKQAYVHNPDVYEKIGGKYYLVLRERGPIKEMYVSTYLKTHFNVAEFGEMGLGFSF